MKTTSLALAAVLVAGSLSFAAPVFANDDTDSFDGDYIVTQLQQKGIDAVAAYEGAPGEVRAVVQLADGKQVFQYFNEDTLQQIGAGSAAAAAPQTRVLSKLDTKPARASNWSSLPTIQTEDDQND